MEFLFQIKTTNAIDIKNIYVRHEYKKASQKKENKPKKNAHSNKFYKKNAQSNESSKKEADQERNFSKITVDVITSSALQVKRLTQLLIAFGETKENRDLVFKRYPELYAKQNALTSEEDQKRSEERQSIIRKGGSDPYHEAFWSHFGPEFDLYADEMRDIDAAVRRDFCKVDLENYQFSEEMNTRQGQMYKFDVALPKGTRNTPPVKDYVQALLRTAQSQMAVQTRI